MTVEYESLGHPIITTEDAVRANSYVENIEPAEIKVGDAKSEFTKLVASVVFQFLLAVCTLADGTIYG